jgi:cystathionine beta-lyase
MRDETRCLMTRPMEVDGFCALQPPLTRAATVVFSDTASFERRYQSFHDGYTYGLYGTPTTHALEEQIAALNRGTRAILTPSGQSAMVLSLLTFLKAGDHLLVPEAVYGSTRSFCDGHLAQIGIAVEFYDPMLGAGIAALMKPATKVVIVESPGSNTMEVQDVPAIANAAHAVGALVVADNTWAGPLLCKALDYGADIVMEALSKHAGGHGDVLMGALTTRDAALHRRLKDMTRLLGLGVSADDAALVLRGVQTMAVRMERSAQSGLALARWLVSRSEVGHVLHPALPDAIGYDVWRRDFAGCNGLFSFLLSQEYAGQEHHFIDALQVFRIGASWGGTHSLVAPQALGRDHPKFGSSDTRLIRLSVGLEALDDLQGDLQHGFDALATMSALSTHEHRPAAE